MNKPRSTSPSPASSTVSPSGGGTTSRRATRRALIKALYQWHLVDAPVIELIEDVRTESRVDQTYFASVLQGIASQTTVIDGHLSPLVDRDWATITPIELSVLRLATYELMVRVEIPFKVIINEALELSKLFGTPEGYRFINGILDRLVAVLR